MPIEMFACKICGHVFGTREEAVECEQLGYGEEAKFKVGDTFSRKTSPDQKVTIIEGPIYRRAGKNNKFSHVPKYKIEGGYKNTGWVGNRYFDFFGLTSSDK